MWGNPEFSQCVKRVAESSDQHFREQRYIISRQPRFRSACKIFGNLCAGREKSRVLALRSAQSSIACRTWKSIKLRFRRHRLLRPAAASLCASRKQRLVYRINLQWPHDFIWPRGKKKIFHSFCPFLVAWSLHRPFSKSLLVKRELTVAILSALNCRLQTARREIAQARTKPRTSATIWKRKILSEWERERGGGGGGKRNRERSRKM